MPKKLFEQGNSGRPKGAKNKATRDIKALIQETVDFKELTEKLRLKALEGEKWAFEMLYQYGFGKPVEVQVAPIQIQQDPKESIKHEHRHTLDAESTGALRDLAKTLTRRATST